MFFSFVFLRKHACDSRSYVSTRSGNNYRIVIVWVARCEHLDCDFHILCCFSSKNGRVEVYIEFKEIHRCAGRQAMIHPSWEIGIARRAPIGFHSCLKVELWSEIIIIKAFISGQPSKEERLGVDMRGSDLDRLYHHDAAVPIYYPKTSGQVCKRRTDKVYRGLSISDHEGCLFSLLVELMEDKVGPDRRGGEADPARQSRDPITKAVLFRLRPRQPTWLRGGTELVKLTVANRPDKHQSKKSVSEIPARPVGLIFIALVHPFALRLLIRKLLVGHNILQPIWSAA